MKRGRENARAAAAAAASVLYSLLLASWQHVNDEQIKKRRNQQSAVPLRLSASYSCTDICAQTPSLGGRGWGSVHLSVGVFGVHVKQAEDVCVCPGVRQQLLSYEGRAAVSSYFLCL